MAASVASFEETLLFEEKEGEDDNPMTEKEAQNITNKLKDKEADIKKILNELQEEKDINVCTWFKGVSQVILFSQASDCQVFGDMKEKISKSIAAYEHFERCLNNEKILENYKDRVDAARIIYRKYWDLLSKTSELMAIIESKVERVLRSIKLCEKIALKRKDKLPTSGAIRSCVNTLNEWIITQEKLNILKQEWRKLGDDARKEEQQWQSIENETNKIYEQNKYTVIKGVLGGLAIVVGIAFVCTGIGAIGVAITGPIGLILAGIATGCEIASVIGGIVGAGAIVAASILVGVKLTKSYLNHKCAVEGLKAMNNTVKSVELIMNEIATQSDKFDNMISKIDQLWIKMKAKTDDIKDTINMMDEENEQQEDNSSNDNNIYLEEIMSLLNEIKNSIATLQKGCEKCREDVDAARNAIVELQTRKKQRK